MPGKPVTLVLSKLGRVKRSGDGWSASCPVEQAHSHGDKHPSLSISEGTDGTALLTCHTGCDLESICAALGIELTALFVDDGPTGKVVIAEYEYTDEAGEVLYVKERLYPKTFLQRRPTKGGWEYKLGRTRRPLYRLPKVLQAKAEGKRIWFVEGERDVGALEARGEVATTAGGVKDFRPEHAEVLKGCDLVIVADNDQEGRKLAQEVAAATGAPILVSELGKDVTAHLNAGGTLDQLVPLSDGPDLRLVEGGRTDAGEELVAMVKDGASVIGESPMPGLPRLDIEASNLRREHTGIHARIANSVNGQELAYDTINIERDASRKLLARSTAAALGDEKKHTQAIKLRLDRFCARAWDVYIDAQAPRLARGSATPAFQMLLDPYLTDSRTILFAPGGAAKSWLALIWSLCINYGLQTPWRTTGPRNVLWIDFEDTPQVFDSRLRQAAKLLNCPDELACYHFEGRRLADVWDPISKHVERNDIGLIVVDSLSRLGLGKLVDDNAANASTDLLNRLEVPWLTLGHTARGSGGDHVFGSAHFEFGARVVIKGEMAQSHDDEGLIGLRLEITKANHVRRGQVQTWAFRFENDELVEHRPAKVGDFPDLADARPVREKVRDFMRSASQMGASAAEIAEFVEASERHVKRVLLDGEGFEYQRVAGGGGRGRTSMWRRVTVSESVT